MALHLLETKETRIVRAVAEGRMTVEEGITELFRDARTASIDSCAGKSASRYSSGPRHPSGVQ